MHVPRVLDARGTCLTRWVGLQVCIIMTEEVESIVWPKHLQGSRRS